MDIDSFIEFCTRDLLKNIILTSALITVGMWGVVGDNKRRAKDMKQDEKPSEKI